MLHNEPTVPLDDAVFAVATQVHGGLVSLSQQLAAQPDDGRRAMIKQFITYARTLLLRLLALVRWLKERHEMLEACRADSIRFQNQHTEMRRAADELFFLHSRDLWQACVPPYDVRAALDVITRGTYTQLPLSIAPADATGDRDAAADARDRSAALDWLRRALRLRRCAWIMPEGMECRDASGCIVCTVEGEYEMAISAQVSTQRGSNPGPATRSLRSPLYSSLPVVAAPRLPHPSAPCGRLL